MKTVVLVFGNHSQSELIKEIKKMAEDAQKIEVLIFKGISIELYKNGNYYSVFVNTFGVVAPLGQFKEDSLDIIFEWDEIARSGAN